MGLNVLERMVRLRSESKDVTFGELNLDDTDPKALAETWLTLKEWATAATQAASLVEAELVKFLPGAPVEAFDQFVYYGQSTRETCIDPVAFHDWLANHPEELNRAYNPNTARKGSLPPAVRETFFEKEKVGEAKVQSVPLEMLGRKK